MNPIDAIYEPYDFSKTRCHVFELKIGKNGFHKIEYNLPQHVKKLKGIFVTTDCTTGIGILSGIISMNFNGQAFKSFQNIVFKNTQLDDCSRPNPFNEDLLPNSFVQGFYYDLTGTVRYPYKVKVYVHYQNEDYK